MQFCAKLGKITEEAIFFGEEKFNFSLNGHNKLSGRKHDTLEVLGNKTGVAGLDLFLSAHKVTTIITYQCSIDLTSVFYMPILYNSWILCNFADGRSEYK